MAWYLLFPTPAQGVSATFARQAADVVSAAHASWNPPLPSLSQPAVVASLHVTDAVCAHTLFVSIESSSWELKLTLCVPHRPWLETTEADGARLKAVVAAVNQEHDLENLCRELPERAQRVKAEKGGRIAK